MPKSKPLSAYANCRNSKSQIVAEIPYCCQNPKLLPKSHIAAKIPNCCRNPILLPKSQIVAEIPNCCRNPILLPKSQIVAEVDKISNYYLSVIYDFYMICYVIDYTYYILYT